MILLLFLISGCLFLIGNGNLVLAENDLYEKLFIGKTEDHWVIEGTKECWFINKNRLCCIANKNGKWIRTQNVFKQFILKFEWKISEGGEGGLIIGLDPTKTTKNDLIRIPILNQLEDNLHCTGSIAGIAPVNKQPDTSPDSWHTMQIHCSKSGLIVYCDGIKRTQITDQQKNAKIIFPLEGYIAFQAVTDHPSNEIQFRDIKIKRLNN